MARNYWNKLKGRLKKEGNQSVTNCHRLKLQASDGKSYLTDTANAETLLRLVQSIVSVKAHKKIKGLKTQNLRDHMNEAELIFTALAELSTRQIAETMQAKGMEENTMAGKSGGKIAKTARVELEHKTGKKVISKDNYLPPQKTTTSLKDK